MLLQKQPFRGVLRKKCSENMQQIYRWVEYPCRSVISIKLQAKVPEEQLWTNASVTSFSLIVFSISDKFHHSSQSWKQLTIVTKCSILDVAAVLDPPLTGMMSFEIFLKRVRWLSKISNISSFLREVFLITPMAIL